MFKRCNQLIVLFLIFSASFSTSQIDSNDDVSCSGNLIRFLQPDTEDYSYQANACSVRRHGEVLQIAIETPWACEGKYRLAPTLFIADLPCSEKPRLENWKIAEENFSVSVIYFDEEKSHSVLCNVTSSKLDSQKFIDTFNFSLKCNQSLPQEYKIELTFPLARVGGEPLTVSSMPDDRGASYLYDCKPKEYQNRTVCNAQVEIVSKKLTESILWRLPSFFQRCVLFPFASFQQESSSYYLLLLQN